MYRNGYKDVFHRVAQLPENVPLSAAKVIVKAIHRALKPDLAIEVAMAAAERGNDAIPVLICTLFSRVLWLARWPSRLSRFALRGPKIKMPVVKLVFFLWIMVNPFQTSARLRPRRPAGRSNWRDFL